VEASEAGRRIFWRHRWLLLALMILPAVGVVALKERQSVTYTATATIQGQGTTPDATTQVSAIQSRVNAVATDPALVQAVIIQAKLSRNATQVAKHDISVSQVSSSAIMAITVTDKTRQAALALSSALATAVVNQLNVLGVKDNPELASLSKTNAELVTKRNQLLAELNSATPNGSTSVHAQTLLSQLDAAEQELANNESQQQQVLATLTTETGASVVSVPTTATGASRHVIVYGALAALLGLVVGLLFATLREVLRPTVAQPGAGARELGAVLFGSAEERAGQIVALDRDLPERVNLAAHRAGVRTIVLTGPGPADRLSSLATQLRGELPSPERADGRALGATLIEPGHGGDPSPNGAAQGPAIVGSEHRPVGLATADQPTGRSSARPLKTRPTVVTLNDIRLATPPPDAALMVALPAFAPHGALDQAADLGVTADWPILGVIGIRRQSRLAALISRWALMPPASTDRGVGDVPQPRDTADTMPQEGPADKTHAEGKDD
jgi:capsular polysaccharide biosynthesis protein